MVPLRCVLFSPVAQIASPIKAAAGKKPQAYPYHRPAPSPPGRALSRGGTLRIFLRRERNAGERCVLARRGRAGEVQAISATGRLPAIPSREPLKVVLIGRPCRLGLTALLVQLRVRSRPVFLPPGFQFIRGVALSG